LGRERTVGRSESGIAGTGWQVGTDGQVTKRCKSGRVKPRPPAHTEYLVDSSEAGPTDSKEGRAGEVGQDRTDWDRWAGTGQDSCGWTVVKKMQRRRVKPGPPTQSIVVYDRVRI
jgi:hypothetical protein